MALFAVTVYHDERVVVVAEQKPSCSDEEVSCGCGLVWVRHSRLLSCPLLQAFKWMNGVLPAVEAIHGVRSGGG